MLPNVTDKVKNKKCTCGTDLNEFYATGLFGCENCYVTFREELEKYVMKYHGDSRHYTYLKEDEEQELRFEEETSRETLRLRFQEYLDAGNYEDADKIAAFLKKKREKV